MASGVVYHLTADKFLSFINGCRELACLGRERTEVDSAENGDSKEEPKCSVTESMIRNDSNQGKEERGESVGCQILHVGNCHGWDVVEDLSMPE